MALDFPFVTTKTIEYTAKYRSSDNKDYRESFLLTHSFGRFKGNQEKNFNIFNESFILDLSRDFVGHFYKEGFTNATVLPFDLLPGTTVDCLKRQKGLSTPLFYAVEYILKNTKNSDDNINNRLQSIVNNLSLIELEGKSYQQIEHIKFFIFQKIERGENINLEIVCENFFISRRKLQYLFESNGTTFREVVRNLKSRLK